MDLRTKSQYSGAVSRLVKGPRCTRWLMGGLCLLHCIPEGGRSRWYSGVQSKASQMPQGARGYSKHCEVDVTFKSLRLAGASRVTHWQLRPRFPPIGTRASWRPGR